MTVNKSPVECFELLKEKVYGIPDDGYAVLNMPYEQAMQEGRRVATLVEKFHGELSASDISAILLDELNARVGAFSYCVATFEAHIEVNESHNEQFVEKCKDGYTIRRKVITRMEYVFRKDKKVLRALANIREGRGNLDMIKDLLSLYKLVEDNRERLEKASFNFEDSQKAYDLYIELSNLAALRDIDPEKVSEVKGLLMKSWTLLWEALEEIYAAGRYVFDTQPDIEELFYIDYWQKMGARNQKTVEKEPESAIETDPSLVDGVVTA